MTVHYLVYASRPFGFDQAMLNAILVTARYNNSRHGITGALIVRADLYLQWLEGPAAALKTLFQRIAADDRHCDILRLEHGVRAQRRFPHWSMRDDPAQSWLWPADAVEAGAVARANPEEIGMIFERLEAAHASA